MTGVDGGLERLNGVTEGEARERLESCCGSRRWVLAMLAERPFADRRRLYEAARRHWQSLGREDWLEAFSHHPRIGERTDKQREAREQAGALGADDRIKAALVEGNRLYEARFGHIYLICAANKSGEELLARLEERLKNDAATELMVAVGEQEKITRLRLEKLLDHDPRP